MNLTDYPTPICEAFFALMWAKDQVTDVDLHESYRKARQLEREAAAWKAVAEMYRGAESGASPELMAADEAFDALKSQLEKP